MVTLEEMLRASEAIQNRGADQGVPSPAPDPGGTTVAGTPSGSPPGASPIDTSQTVPLGAGADPNSNITRIDPTFPQFHPEIGGGKIDLHQVLATHEQTEKGLLNQGYHIDAAHEEATAAEKQSLEAAGGDWKKYSEVMDAHLAKSERDHPAHPPSVMPEQQAGAPGQPGVQAPKSLEDMLAQSEEIQSKGAEQHGALRNLLAGFNGKVADLVGMVPSGPPLTMVMEKLGNDYFKTGKMASARKMFNELGIGTEYDPGSFMGNVGANTMDALVTFAGIQAAAPAMAAKAGYTTTAYLSRALGDAMIKHPWLGIVGTIASEPGSTLGGEYGPGHAMLGGIASQAAMSPAMAAAKPFIWAGKKIAKPIATGVANALDGIAKWMGASEEMLAATKTWGQKPSTFTSPPTEILERYTMAEQRARDAGDEVSAAAAANREAKKGGLSFEDQHAAWKRFDDAKKVEAMEIRVADRAFKELPANVRGQYSRETEAIRAKFAEPTYIREFADEQIKGDRALAEQRVQTVLESIKPDEPGLTGQDYSERIVRGLQEARDASIKIKDEYYSRVPLKDVTLPRGKPQRDMDDLLNTWKQGSEDDIPYKKLGQLREIFATGIVDGRPTSRPTAAKLYSEIKSIDGIRADYQNRGKSLTWARNLGMLEDRANAWLEEAMPNNIAMQQARGYARSHGSMFHDGEIGTILATKGRGQVPRTRPEDALEVLMSKRHGIEDIYKVVDGLQRQNRMPNYIKGKEYDFARLTPKQAAGVEKLRQDTENGLRQSFQEAVAAAGADPEKVAKATARWRPRIAHFAQASAEMETALKEALGHMEARATMEKSALVKYLEKKDPTDAVEAIWGSRNPAATARAVMRGDAGVGGFIKDPKAMEGFRAAMVDKLMKASSATAEPDVFAIQARLKDKDTNALMRTVLGQDRFEQLDSMIDHSVAILKSPERNKYIEWTVLAGRWATLKASALLPRLGGGGQLQQAALMSEMAKRQITAYFAKQNPVTLLGEAIKDPHFAHLLFKVPVADDAKKVAESVMALRRVTRFNVGVINAYHAIAGNTDASPPATPASSSEPLYWQEHSALPQPNMQVAEVQPINAMNAGANNTIKTDSLHGEGMYNARARSRINAPNIPTSNPFNVDRVLDKPKQVPGNLGPFQPWNVQL